MVANAMVKLSATLFTNTLRYMLIPDVKTYTMISTGKRFKLLPVKKLSLSNKNDTVKKATNNRGK